MIYQAHRGFSSRYPENTLLAIQKAIEEGYRAIEVDVSFTADRVPLLLHDATLNRTGRDKNGNPPPAPLPLKDLTLEEAMTWEVGSWFSPQFQGERMPLFRDVLSLGRKHGIPIKIDNKFRKNSPEEKEVLFSLAEEFEDCACLTFFDAEELLAATQRFQKMHLHYDGAVTEEILSLFQEKLSPERLTVWLPLETPRTSWVRVAFADCDLAKRVKSVARLGLWCLEEEEEREKALLLGADIVETNGKLLPNPVL